MKQESESTPRVITRRTIVFRFILEKLPASRKLLYAGCVTSAVGAHPCARQCSVALRRLRSQQAATLPMWQPARRLGARRYVKELCSPREGTAKLYPIAPWDARGHAQKAAVLSKIVKTLSATLRLGLTCRVENLQRRIKSSEIRLVPSY